MSIVYKIILGIASLGILAFLVFFTFFDVSTPSIDTTKNSFLETGKYHLGVDKDSYTLTNFSTGSTATGNIVLEVLNDFDFLFASQKSQYSYSLTSSTGSILNIGKGEFVVSRTDFFTPTEYVSENFRITPEGIGKIYIRSDSEKQILFALDGIFRIDLLGQDGKKSSSLTLYPHQYFIFNPKDIIYVFNADHLRLQSVFEYKYFPFSILEANFTTRPQIQNLGVDGSFLNLVYGYLIGQEQSYVLELRKMRSHIGIYDIPGMEYIQKYAYLFFNETKKQVYYKNIVLGILESIIKEKDPEKMETLKADFLVKYREYFSNSPEKEKMDKLIFDMYVKLLHISDESFSLQQIALANLYQELYKREPISPEFLTSQFLIHNLYSFYDQNHSAGFYIRLVSFLNQYFKAIGIVKTETLDDTKTYTLHDLEYLGFYLESILVSNLVESTNILASLNDILSKYNLLNSLVYSQVNSTLKTTGLYINLELLRNIGSYVSTTYFISERTDNSLLQKKGGIQDIEAIENLKVNFEEIKKFYDANSQFLNDTDSRDVELKKHYTTIFSDYQEYFLALLDYDNYLLNFDPVSRALRDKIGYIDNNNSNSDILSESILISYLSQFTGLDISNAQIEVKDDMYSLQNGYIAGKKISFDIYPYSGYELTNIILNDEQRRESYKLENIKDDWQGKTLNSSDAKEYDFAQFFIKKFIAQKVEDQLPEDNPTILEEIYDCPEETKIIRSFKIQLFDKVKGPFVPLGNSLFIDYKNLCVIGDIENAFEMQLQGPTVQFSGAGQMSALLEGNFSLEQNLSKFENLKLFPFLVDTGGQKKYKWNKLPIIVRGFIVLNEFEENMNAISQMLPNIDHIFQALSQVSDIQNIEINYFVARKRMVIKFDFKGNKANIGLNATGVDSFIYSNKNILTEKTSLADISEIIVNLK